MTVMTTRLTRTVVTPGPLSSLDIPTLVDSRTLPTTIKRHTQILEAPSTQHAWFP